MSSKFFKVKKGINIQPTDASSILNPQAGDLIVDSSDSNKLKKYNEVSASFDEISRSGAGGIDYIDNGDFESGITGFTGSLNLVISPETTNPLRGSTSLKINKAAADASGEIVSTLFTIDDADLAKVMIVSFDKDFSDANYNDGDAQVFITQDPLGTPVTIRVNGEDILGGKNKHYARFQTDAVVKDYRLDIVWNATSTDAVEALIDNVSVGPQVISNSAFNAVEIIDLAGSGDFTTGKIVVSRSGNNVTISGLENFSFPSGSVIESGTVLPSWAIPTNQKTNVSDAGGSTIVVVRIKETGTFGLEFRNYSGASVNTSGSGFLQGISYAVDGASNYQISSDFSGRDVVVRGVGNGGESITANVTDIPFIEVEDTTASFNGSQFTAPETGYYLVSGSVIFTSALNSVISAYIDGSLDKAANENTGSFLSKTINTVVRLEKDQSLSFRTNISGTLSNNSQFHNIHIQKLATPQTQLQSETVAARYTSNAGQVVGVGANVVYEDLDFDTHNAYNSTTGEYTTIESQILEVEASFLPSASTTDLYVSIHVNGVAVKTEVALAANNKDTISVKDVLNLKKDDVVTIKNNSVASVTLITSPGYNTVTFNKVK